MDELVVTVDIKDLIKRVLKKWKIILIVALIFALVFGAYGAYKGTNEYNIKNNFVQNIGYYDFANFKVQDLYRVPNFENYIITSEGTLDEEVASELDIAIGKYESYTLAIDGIENYLENGVYPNVDNLKAPKYNEIYAIKLKDGISTNYEVIANTVSEYLEAQLINDSLYQEISEKVVSQVGDIWNDTVYVNDSVLVTDDMVVLPSANFKVSIVADTKENTTLIKEIVKSKMASAIEMAKANFTEYGVEIVLIGENYLEQEELGIINVREAKQKLLTSYKTAIDDISKSLSANALSMYNGLINVLGKEYNNEYTVQKDLIDLKLIAIGFVVGAFLVCLYIALKYLFQKELRRPEDLEEIFNVPLFNVIKKDDNSLYTRTAKDIELTIKELKLKSLYLGGGESDGLKELRKEMYNLLDGKVQVEVKTDIEDNNIIEMSKSDTAVLLYEVDNSKYEDIYKEIELSKRMGTKVIGFIAYRG